MIYIVTIVSFIVSFTKSVYIVQYQIKLPLKIIYKSSTNMRSWIIIIPISLSNDIF